MGLIGGSFARRCAARARSGTVVGVDRNAQALERAAALGVIDTAAESVSDAAPARTWWWLPCRCARSAAVLHDVALALDPGAVVTDVGQHQGGDHPRRARGAARPLPALRSRPPDRGARGVGRRRRYRRPLQGRARRARRRSPETAPDAVDLVRACWEAAGGARRHLDAPATTASSRP